MKKTLITALLSFFTFSVFSQTTVSGSFECHIKPELQGFTQAQIENYISKASLEQYRLLDIRTTLVFDNGFDIVLLSANEAAAKGLISNPSSYGVKSESKYGLPSFHLAPNGMIGIHPPSASTYNKKYTTK